MQINPKTIQYLEAVLEANKTINLTRITSLEEALTLHIEDSLIALTEVNDAPEGLYGDLGSGGGFPGVPLALETGRQTILVDSVQKKMAVVAAILDQLKLDKLIETYSGRIEDLSQEYPCSFAVLTARALAKLSVLLELASPLLCQGGILVCFKANVDEDELSHALAIQNKVGMKLVSDRSLTLGDKKKIRRIICFKKMQDPKLSLPRRVGFAQKRPL